MKTKLLSIILSLVMACTLVAVPSCSILEGLFGTPSAPSTPEGGNNEGGQKEPEHEHLYVKSVKNANCVQGGYTLYACECGDSYKENETEALGHTPVEKEGKDASCTEDGRTPGTYCDVCGEPIDNGEVIPAKGHSWTAWSVSGEMQTRSCPDCGSVQSVPVHTHTGRADSAVSSKEDCAECSSLHKITPREGNVLYGYYDLFYLANGETMQDLYFKLYGLCEAFIDSTDDVTGTVNGQSVNYFIGETDLSGYNITADEVYAVWKVFYLDNPAYYWLANGCMIYTVNDSPSRLPLRIDGYYADYQSRKEANNSISALRADFAGFVTNADGEKEAARKIHDFIANRIDYAYSADNDPESSVWAHNIDGVASEKGGVCEAYAKTYSYLCELSGLDCILVSGYAFTNGSAEGHAWNYVKIDGKWYGVDVTWDDQPNRIFYTYMGASESDLSDHVASTPQDTGINYLYQLPELSAVRLVYV